MKKKIVKFIRNEKAFSLTEVLIAVVILGLAGATIINGITTDTKVRDKTNSSTNKSIDLNSAAEVLLSSKVAFAPCNSNSISFYENKFRIDFPKVIISKVEGLQLTNPPSWVDCGSLTSNIQTSLQKIYLSTTDTVNKRNYEKQILKTDSTVDTGVASSFLITADKSKLKLAAEGVSSCGSYDTINLSNSIRTSQIVYAAVSDSPTIAQAIATGSVLKVTGISPGNTQITIQAVSLNQNNVTSEPIHIDITVTNAITFSSLSQRISVQNYPRTLKTTGIYDKVTPSGYSPLVELIDSSSPFKLTSGLSGENGTFDWKSNATTSPIGLYSNQIKISMSGFPNATNCTDASWKIPIKINPPLTFNLDLSGDKCILGTTTSCSIPVITSNGSGSGITGEIGHNTYVSGKLSIDGASCKSPFTTFKKESGPNGIPALSNVTGSNNTQVQVLLDLTQNQITTIKLAATANLTFAKPNGNNATAPNPLNSWSIASVSQPAGSLLTYIILQAPPGTTANVSTYTPEGLQIMTFHSMYPTLNDLNFSTLSPSEGTSYSSISLTPLPLYCQ